MPYRFNKTLNGKEIEVETTTTNIVIRDGSKTPNATEKPDDVLDKKSHTAYEANIDDDLDSDEPRPAVI